MTLLTIIVTCGLATQILLLSSIMRLVFDIKHECTILTRLYKIQLNSRHGEKND